MVAIKVPVEFNALLPKGHCELGPNSVPGIHVQLGHPP